MAKALQSHKRRQARDRMASGPAWQDLGLVFAARVGTPIDPSNLRRDLSRVTHKAGLGHWHPHELRHSAVSLLCAAGLRLEEVAEVMGHGSTRMTGDVYRHVQPVVAAGSTPMEGLFED